MPTRSLSRDVRRIRELRYMEGLSAAQTARQIGCCERTVTRYAPGRPGKIDNAALREAFRASGLSSSQVVTRLGWYPSKRNAGRVLRIIGLLEDVNGRGQRSIRRFVDAETVGDVSEALGLQRWECGGC